MLLTPKFHCKMQFENIFLLLSLVIVFLVHPIINGQYFFRLYFFFHLKRLQMNVFSLTISSVTSFTKKKTESTQSKNVF